MLSLFPVFSTGPRPPRKVIAAAAAAAAAKTTTATATTTTTTTTTREGGLCFCGLMVFSTNSSWRFHHQELFSMTSLLSLIFKTKNPIKIRSRTDIFELLFFQLFCQMPCVGEK